jgi:hypothetical protein
MDADELDRLLHSFTDSVFRLETRQEYAVDRESERYATFRETGTLPPREPNPLIAKLVADGKWIHRVHVVDLPLTDYLRYELAEYEFNVAEGEAVHIAVRDEIPALEPLRRDFLLFDADTRRPTLVWVRYDDDGRLLAWERDRDPQSINYAVRQRNVAVDFSVPLHLWKQRA